MLVLNEDAVAGFQRVKRPAVRLVSGFLAAYVLTLLTLLADEG